VRQALDRRVAVVSLLALPMSGVAGGCNPPRRTSAYESSRLATAAVEAGVSAGQAYLRDHCEEGIFFRKLVSTEARPSPLGDENTFEALVESTRCPGEVVMRSFGRRRSAVQGQAAPE
jgi:hypothetical protein